MGVNSSKGGKLKRELSPQNEPIHSLHARGISLTSEAELSVSVPKIRPLPLKIDTTSNHNGSSSSVGEAGGGDARKNGINGTSGKGAAEALFTSPECSCNPTDNLRPPLSPKNLFCPTSPIPTYSSELSVALPSTPMLRSYRLHSFSQQESTLSSPLSPGLSSPPIHTRFLEINGYPAGLENYGNTCYCNAVIQLLYHCSPLRLRLLELYQIYAKGAGHTGFEEDTLLALVADLFAKMHKANNQKRHRKDAIAPKALISSIKEQNAAFNNTLQQDAHEFTMFLLSKMIETEKRMMGDEKNRALFFGAKKGKGPKWWNVLRRGRKRDGSWQATGVGDVQEEDVELPPALRDGNDVPRPANAPSGSGDASDARMAATFTAAAAATTTTTTTAAEADWSAVSPIQVIFGGQFASLTACFECERTKTTREVFLDLSLDIEQGSSLLRCVSNFGSPELFYGANKLHCEHCKKHVVAQKLLRVHRLPEYALLVHLKRFEYNEKTGKLTKRSDHVAVPNEIDVVEYEPWDDSNGASKSGVSECDLHAACPPGSPSVAVEARAVAEGEDAASAPRPSVHLMNKLDGVVHRKGRFALSGFVTHLGDGPDVGHYFTCVRHGGRWCLFNDATVTELTEYEVQKFWGVPIPVSGVVTATAYILLYERVA
ncbi:putative ubiquitin carboxyl-terminal hydrolase, putative,cysteine peptidase, Clan CA, family C19 [Trypanosoma cruzi]|uniref:Ubiquitin carboxyl-terminal hydrolase n=1 Tax=Trypanosoma cruzi TaxID=5693 RepID=A0A2V2VST0_TRYCR|nr:putative ubiquitin carboxyl-terminal hydrolase, putative,cysteine peptidase, Clan CA, family C19 [Trypanosoma cruzi]